MIRSATAIALDGRERRRIQPATRRRRARHVSAAAAAAATTIFRRVIGTHARDMPKVAAILQNQEQNKHIPCHHHHHHQSHRAFFFFRAGDGRTNETGRRHETTHVASLVRALEAQRRTLGLDVADASARVALFGGDGARLGARRRLVARFATVVAEPLLRRTVLGDVADCRYNMSSASLGVCMGSRPSRERKCGGGQEGAGGGGVINGEVFRRTISAFEAPLPGDVRHI